MQVAEWCPDMPDLAEATNIAVNVIALTPESYGPLRQLQQFTTNNLAGPCLGMGFAEDSAAVTDIFAGTPTALEMIATAGTAWADVSGATYTATMEDNWRFAQFGDLMIATDYTDPVQVFDMISGTVFADLTPGPFDTGNNQAAPKAAFLAVAKTFLILAHTNDAVGGVNPARVWWGPSNAPLGVVSGGKTGWPVPGTTLAQQNQSDYTDLNGPQGAITGLAPNLSGCDCAVFFERGVFNMFYAGPPDVFNFYPVANVRGCLAPNSIVQLGSLVYYLGEDGFYTFDGTQSTPIGANKVDKWFASVVDQSDLNLVVGAPDIANKAIVWIFRSLYAPSATQDKMLIYRWDIGRWSSGLATIQWIARAPAPTAVLDSPIVQDQVSLAAIVGDANASLSPILTESGVKINTESGLHLLTEQSNAGFLAYFTGAPLPAQIGTQVVQITPGARSWVGDHVRPLVNSAQSGLLLLTESGSPILQENGIALMTEDASAQITVALSARNTYYEAEVFGPEVAPNVMGECPQRSDGRYHRGRISIPSGIWTTIFGLDAQGIRAGLR